MLERRKYRDAILTLLSDRPMVFVSGPRQCGKTTLAVKQVAGNFEDVVYVNYDDQRVKAQIVEEPYFFAASPRRSKSPPLVIFDEIHKHRNWKNYLKGIYDSFHKDFRFLVTGSGRLDLYRKGGDSMLGRYFHLRLFPFTLSELANTTLKVPALDEPFEVPSDKRNRAVFERLTRFSGFPEPYHRANARFKNLWSRNYHQQLVREDVRDALMVREIDALATLHALLPSRVGSPLSVNNLASALRVSHKTVGAWLSAFENLNLCFRVSPWHTSLTRAVVKEQKLYLLDYTQVSEEGPLLENMAAVELQRAVTFWTDLGHGSYSLHYVRLKSKEEVDFLVCERRRPLCLFEVKLSDDTPSPGLLKIQRMMNVPSVLLVKNIDYFKVLGKNARMRTLVAPMAHYFGRLP